MEPADALAAGPPGGPGSLQSRCVGVFRVLGEFEAHQWFLSLMREHEEFEVETDRAGEPPMPFCSDMPVRVGARMFPSAFTRIRWQRRGDGAMSRSIDPSF